jgi:aminoglycoside/choline kinase family phosphotransferase
MAGDASARRFWRLHAPGGTTRVVMDYGAPFEADPDDLALGGIFRAAGVRVAGVERIVPDAGCIVVEDLGDETLESAIRRHRELGRSIEPLYDAAVDLAARIATAGTVALAASSRASGPALDPSRFRFEMDFFVEHFVEGWLGARASDGLRREVRDLAERAALATRRQVLCHRDYHSRNLMVLPEGGLAAVDIQDARWGPDTYDLASLLRDAYVDLEPSIVQRGIERYRAAVFPDEDAEPFLARFELVSLQRMVKALGTFGFQATVRGRTGYLEGVPRTVGRILRLRALAPGYPTLNGVLASVPEVGPGGR